MVAPSNHFLQCKINYFNDFNDFFTFYYVKRENWAQPLTNIEEIYHFSILIFYGNKQLLAMTLLEIQKLVQNGTPY